MKGKLIDGIIYIILAIGAVFFLLPMIFNFANSFFSPEEIKSVYKNVMDMGTDNQYSQLALCPKVFSLKQYYGVLFKELYFYKMFRNTMIIVVPSVFFSTLLSVGAEYGLAKGKFKYKNVILYIYMIISMLPYQILIVLNYIIMEKLNLVGELKAIIIILSFSPLGAVLMRQFIIKIPDEIPESARIDGANEVYILFKIVLPMITSGIVSYIFIELVEIFSMIEYPKVFLNDKGLYPLSVGPGNMNNPDIGNICAGAVKKL